MPLRGGQGLTRQSVPLVLPWLPLWGNWHEVTGGGHIAALYNKHKARGRRNSAPRGRIHLKLGIRQQRTDQIIDIGGDIGIGSVEGL